MQQPQLGLLERLGAEGVVMDGLDAASVGEAVAAARPDAIVNQMTGLSEAHAGKPNLRKAERFFATTNRLRSEGIDHLLAAAEATGVSHIVAQSHASMNGIRTGGWVKTEEDPLEVVAGTKTINHLEDVVVRAGGAVLRYGGCYGPGANDDQVKMVCKRLFSARRGWHRLCLVGACRRRDERHRPGSGAEGERRVHHRRRRAGTCQRVASLSRGARRGLVGNGGGKAPALAKGVVGADNVGRVLASIFPVLARIDARMEPCEVNGQPGAILRDRDGNLASTLTLRHLRRADPDDPRGS
jgi:hypothetical protein